MHFQMTLDHNYENLGFLLWFLYSTISFIVDVILYINAENLHVIVLNGMKQNNGFKLKDAKS